MKKQIVKNLMSIFLSLVTVLSIGLTAFADEQTYSLTLTGTMTGHTYEAYQIFSGDLTQENGTKVLSNVKWGKGVTYNGTESATEVAQALADGKSMTIAQLEENLKLNTPVKTVVSSKDNTVIDGLAAGYYLVKDKDGSQKDSSDAYTEFIVQVVGDTTAAIKSSVPTVVKKVQDANDSTDTDRTVHEWQDSADYDIGDSIPYQITGTMPSNIDKYTTYKYVFTDTMSKGMTYTAKTATITIGNTVVTTSFSETITPNDNGSTTVTWSCDDLKKISGVTLTKDSKVVVTYNCTLNENAVIGSAGNPNTVNLTFSNNPNQGGDGETGKTPDDKNIVFTYKVVVNKVDQDHKALAGAEFSFSKVNADNTSTVVKTFTLTGNTEKDPTTFTASGLDDGTYVLKETKTPAGYNTIDDQYFTITAEHDAAADDPTLKSLSGNKLTSSAQTTITFEANTSAGSLTTNVENKKGSTLPSTGGIGTTIFYVAGCALVVLAGVMITARRRAN